LKRKSLIGNVVRILLSLVALALLFRQVGGQSILSTLLDARFGLLFLAWILFMGGIVVRAYRWRALLLGLGIRPGFWTLLKLYLVGGFFNTFLPSGFGGDVVRVVELAQDEDRSAAVGTVLVDRMTGLLSLMAMGLVVLPFAPDLVPWLRWTFLAISIGGLAGGALVLEGRFLGRLTSKLPGGLSLVGEGPLAQVYAAVTGAGWRAVGVALLASTLFNGLNVVVYWLCALAVGIEVGLPFFFIVVPLLSLTLLIPISVGGLGARDWVAQPLMASVAVAETQAAAWTLGVWAVTAAAGLVGGVLYVGQAISGLADRSSEMNR
jgi:hypothetical protein